MAPKSNASAALPEHCYYCFEQIRRYLDERNGKNSDEIVVEFDNEGVEYPLFITWNIFPASVLSRAASSLAGSGSSPRLRGCIGTFEPLPLKEGLKSYSEIAAFKDRRFSPISEKEVPRLECGVSLLTHFEDCEDYLDWDIGTHGIYIHLPNPALAPPRLEGESASSSSSSSGSSTPASSLARTVSKRRSGGRSAFGARGSEPTFLTATYLPDVMPAQGWTKVEAIDSAIQKAGYDGKITEAMRRSLKVRRYQSEKCIKTADDWMTWRNSQQASSPI
ncbi:unnamed protein product [Sympodiomycopsis kandeliae]